jgi:hypothetical protein
LVIWTRPELRRLHRQRPSRLGAHLLQRAADTRGRRGGHRALDEWCVAELHASTAGEQLDRHLSAHQRAAEIHQHEHAVL